jgi:glycosyltransferase involved in cell wall biosynthesis
MVIYGPLREYLSGAPSKEINMPELPKPRYSFIIPAYNEEALLGRTLDAIHESASPLKGGFEIVVANDDSTDRTPEIAREKGARVIDVKKRQIAAVRNAGASIATGDILVFVDADTLVTKETLLALEKLLLRPEVVGGGARMIFDAAPAWWGVIAVRVFLFFYFDLARWAGGGFLFTRRDAFDKAGGWDEKYFASEEVHLSRALKRLGKFRIIREPVITSARKFRMKTGREHIALLRHIVFKGKKSLQTREGLDMWYDGSREK